MSQALSYEDVLQTARALDEPDRARLVEELLGSLSPSLAVPLDDAWLAEIERRSGEIDAGTVQAVGWNEVRRRARERAGLHG